MDPTIYTQLPIKALPGLKAVMRALLLVFLFLSPIYAVPADTISTLKNHWAASVNALGLVTFGLGVGAEYGSNNAISINGVIGNTSLPLIIIRQEMSDTISFFAGGVSLGYAHYFNKTHPLKGFFLRPSIGVYCLRTDDIAFRFHETTILLMTSLLYLTLSNDIGYRWVLEDKYLLGLGISVGGAFQINREKLFWFDRVLRTIPYGGLILEVGYLF